MQCEYRKVKYKSIGIKLLVKLMTYNIIEVL